MTKKTYKKITGSIIFISIIVIFFIAVSHTQAIEQNCSIIHTLNKSQLNDCKMQIESDIQERSIKFNEVTKTTAMYRELVSTGEAEMSALHSQNSSDRVRLRIINRLIDSFQKG